MPGLLKTNRWLVLASAVVSFFAVGCTFFAVPPLLPELVRRFGLSHFQVGLLMGAISVPAIFLSIPLGTAVDRRPPRAVGVTGLLLMVAGAILFAIAPSYPVLLLGRLVFGVGGLLINLLTAQLITTAFAERELAMAMGIFSAVYPASMIAVFSFHSHLLATLGWRLELMLLALLALLALPLHLAAAPRYVQPAEAATPATTQRPRPDRRLIGLALSWLLFFVAFAPVVTFAPQWAGGGREALLTVTLIYWIALVLCPVFGALIDRWGHAERWLGAGLLLFAVVLTAMALGVISPFAAMLLVGLTAATVPTATYALPGRLVAPAQVGFAFGFITAFSNLGTLIGPSMAGAIHDHSNQWFGPWISLAVAALLGVASLWLMRSRSV